MKEIYIGAQESLFATSISNGNIRNSVIPKIPRHLASSLYDYD